MLCLVCPITASRLLWSGLDQDDLRWPKYFNHTNFSWIVSELITMKCDTWDEPNRDYIRFGEKIYCPPFCSGPYLTPKRTLKWGLKAIRYILVLVVQEAVGEHKLRPITTSSIPPCPHVSGGRRRHVLTDSPAERVSVGKGAFTGKCQTNSCVKVPQIGRWWQEARLFSLKIKAKKSSLRKTI